ncbi:PAS domain-containing sensor histidine kinase [Mucilaginibacter sp.]|uniref:PAS domain-containing sensor histidine kinase n=1 Tax=Mucilaginibacter sp. TaxID=1882438 RepID=UPI003D0980E0
MDTIKSLIKDIEALKDENLLLRSALSGKEVTSQLLMYQESQLRFRTVFEYSRLGNKIISSDLKIIQVNPALVALLGYQHKEEIIGTQILDYTPLAYQKDWRILREHLWKGTTPSLSFETCLSKKDGTVIWCHITSILFPDKGETLGYTIIEDITIQHNLKQHEDDLLAELKSLNKELVASNEQKSKLFSIIGHDLRNPISGSLQLLGLTINDIDDTPAVDLHTNLIHIKQELSGASELLEELLAWATAQFATLAFKPVSIKNLTGQIQKCVQRILPTAKKKGIEITYAIDSKLNLVADKDMLEAIIRNLLSNAIKFTNRGGNVNITVIAFDQGTKFSVTDTGEGIPKDKISKLFDRNSNYTTYGTASEKGTGIGLKICYEFVARHGGRIWVESEKGLGSIFYFTIPKIDL